MQETDTPIGAALREVPGDLAGSSGTHVLVLITDGEETCGGDPAAAIRALKAKGIDARVNIVGFGLSDKRLKKSMQGWARLGNGGYFDARDSAQLARAVADAVSAPFRVLDAERQRGRRRDGRRRGRQGAPGHLQRGGAHQPHGPLRRGRRGTGQAGRAGRAGTGAVAERAR